MWKYIVCDGDHTGMLVLPNYFQDRSQCRSHKWYPVTDNDYIRFYFFQRPSHLDPVEWIDGIDFRKNGYSFRSRTFCILCFAGEKEWRVLQWKRIDAAVITYRSEFLRKALIKTGKSPAKRISRADYDDCWNQWISIFEWAIYLFELGFLGFRDSWIDYPKSAGFFYHR